MGLACAAFGALHLGAQQDDPAKQYSNPVLFADYSDPDVIRDGKDFYLIASSFHFVPGIPILHSLDLVHWEITGHVVPRLNMSPAYDMQGGQRYAGGVWAPSVRFHNGLYYVYFPTPDEGIFVSTSPKMTGPWSEPAVVLAGPGWEDPCPFWDDDGTAYLVHSKLRAGPLILHRMSSDGKRLLDAGKVIVNDPEKLPVLEGPKFYKRNGWYYILAPMGGVGIGQQVALRSRKIDGPYESRVVLAQGETAVNGPHQGGWVDSPDGRGWFVHFQQRGAHGRIVWLEPLSWKDDWPMMGTAVARGGEGEPVLTGDLPVKSVAVAGVHPQTSDEFSEATLSPMWEWNHNPVDTHWSLTERKGFLRLHPMQAADLKQARNTLTECTQDEALEVTVRLDVSRMRDGDRAGLSIFDRGLHGVGVMQANGRRSLLRPGTVEHAAGTQTSPAPAMPDIVQLRAALHGDQVVYSYSLDDGNSFQTASTPVKVGFSWWKGARPAVFAYSTEPDSNGLIDVDWVRYRPLPD